MGRDPAGTHRQPLPLKGAAVPAIRELHCFPTGPQASLAWSPLLRPWGASFLNPTLY